jgi:hypothetical protein
MASLSPSSTLTTMSPPHPDTVESVEEKRSEESVEPATNLGVVIPDGGVQAWATVAGSYGFSYLPSPPVF